MRKLNLALSVMFISTISFNSNANMASWFGESSESSSGSMAKTLSAFYGTESPDTENQDEQASGDSIKETKQRDVVENLEPRPQSGLMIAQQQRLKELGQQAEAEINRSALNQPTNQYQNSQQTMESQPTVVEKKSVDNLVSATEREQMAEQQKMEVFISKSQQFLDSNTLSSLQGDQTIAISMLNSALMQLGVEAMSGMSVSVNNPTYNQAVGCVNSFANQQLNQASQNLISKYASLANIMPTVRAAPQIGGKYTAKCF